MPRMARCPSLWCVIGFFEPAPVFLLRNSFQFSPILACVDTQAGPHPPSNIAPRNSTTHVYSEVFDELTGQMRDRYVSRRPLFRFIQLNFTLSSQTRLLTTHSTWRFLLAANRFRWRSPTTKAISHPLRPKRYIHQTERGASSLVRGCCFANRR